MHKIVFALLFASLSGCPQSSPGQTSTSSAPAVNQPVAPTLLVAYDQRRSQTLDGNWHYIADPYREGVPRPGNHGGYSADKTVLPDSNEPLEYNFATSPTLRVPGDWNSQVESLRFYEGTIWYERHFLYEVQPNHRTFLHLGAANYRSSLYLNSRLICTHEGGFTPFDCEVTQAIKSGENSIVIDVDSTRLADGVPGLKTDWVNYGGITRDISLLTTPQQFVDDFDLHLDRATRTSIEGYVHVEGAQPGAHVSVMIPELRLQSSGVTAPDGRVLVKLPVKGMTFWSPSTPKLYKVQITAEADTLIDEIGFRTIGTLGSRILLNGKPITLHGVSAHAEAPNHGGGVTNDQDVGTLFVWMRELGANYVRLVGYPHDERMTRAADRLGLLVWSEIPLYGSERFGNEAVFEKTKAQLHDMIRRDRDKASVILWSVADRTPVSEQRNAFLTRSVAFVHEEDPSRLVTAALLVRTEDKTKIIDDPLGKTLDVIGFDESIGWGDGSPEACDTTIWQVAYDKPLIANEFGAGAKQGMHGKDTELWTEEYQANVFTHQIAMLNKIPQLRGVSPSVLMDFHSPSAHLPGIEDGFNREGLLSGEGKRKAAFLVLQKVYKENSLGHAE